MSRLWVTVLVATLGVWSSPGVGVQGQFSMSLKDVGITDDIQSVASSLNDIFKESFEAMTGSLGKHGVYYLPEMRREYQHQWGPSDANTTGYMQAFNGWMKNPVLSMVKEVASGALRKYKVPLAPSMREVLLVCVGCVQVSAQTVNYCYEASLDARNASGTIVSGPVVYTLSLELRVTQTLKSNNHNHNQVSAGGACDVYMGERSFELSEQSSLRSEVRGLRTLNFLADKMDGWLAEHFNSTVRTQLEARLLTALRKTFAKHNTCEELIHG